MFKVLEKYDTGLVKRFEYQGFEFNWCDWLLCEVAFERSNPIHFAIVSSFRESENRKGKQIITASIYNPSYEGEMDFFDLTKLAWFKIVKIVHKSSDRPCKNMPGD